MVERTVGGERRRGRRATGMLQAREGIVCNVWAVLADTCAAQVLLRNEVQAALRAPIADAAAVLTTVKWRLGGCDHCKAVDEPQRKWQHGESAKAACEGASLAMGSGKNYTTFMKYMYRSYPH